MSIDSLPPTMPHLLVDLSIATGALRYGASGFLYGLGDDGVPNENTLVPIKPQVAAQKAPDGLQHPNGDAFNVGATFQRAGGRQIQIYIQDSYPNWPYDDLGLNDYLAKVETVVRAVSTHPQRDLYAYVPLNEPDLIWYGRSPEQQAALRQDWKTIYHKIRSLDPTGPIVGPNYASYHNQYLAEFMTFCNEHDCLPDIISWHELSSDFYTNWYHHYDHYRAVERSLGLAPREIAINEYANFMDLSVPGQLIQWIARFETSKVDACLAYWHAAGDLCNLAIHSNQVTGGWWLYKWYADMTGHTVQVTPPDAHAAGLQGIAALDAKKRQIRVLFGGSSGRTAVIVRGFDTAPILGNRVHVAIWSTEWTGVEGPSRGPTFEREGDYTVVDGQIVITLDALDAASAYHMIITDAASTMPQREQKPWRVSYEAEDAALTSATVQDGGSLRIPNNNYCSNGRYVGDITHDDSRVTFTAVVAAAGDYLLDMFYANRHGAMAQQFLQLDDGPWHLIEYPPNVGAHFFARQSVPLTLTHGAHTITLATYAESLGRATLSVDIDKIDLTEVTATSTTRWYEAEYASLFGSAAICEQVAGYTGAGYVDFGSGDDAAVQFAISADADGWYDIGLSYAAGPSNGAPADRAVDLVLNGTPIAQVACPATAGWDAWATSGVQVFLQAGISRVTLQTFAAGGRCAIALDAIAVAPSSGPVATYETEAAANTLGGTASVAHDPYASAGSYVGGIGNGVANYLQFNQISVPTEGLYRMIVSFANAEKIGIHDYNVNVVDRGAQISVNGGSATTYYFRNTFGWNAYRTVVVDVQLQAGANTIRFSNDTASAPHIDKITIASVIRDAKIKNHPMPTA